MLLTLYNITMASGNPSALTSLLPGGTTGVQTAGTSANPMLAAPFIEPLDREVADQTLNGAVATPAAQGKLVAQVFSGNPGGGNFALQSIPQQMLPQFSYGVVIKAADPGAAPGTEAVIRQAGVCNAFCTTGTNAISAGSFLCADGNGNLTSLQPPSAAPTPTVTPVGTAGAVTVNYALVAISLDGVPTAIGTNGQTTTSNATLSNANYNQITWTPSPDASAYIVLRTTAVGLTPSTVGAIGQVPGNVSSFNDTGLPILSNTSATQAFPRLNAPGAPTVANTGASGAISYSYKVSAILPNGVYSVESAAGTNATGVATLSAANANKVTWTNVAGAVLYAIDRTAGGATQGLVGFATSGVTGFVDNGIAATTFTAVTTPNPVPRDGVVLGLALGSLPASTTTPTQVPVMLGVF